MEVNVDMGSDFWKKLEAGAEKAMNYMEKKNEATLRQLERKKAEYRRQLVKASDDEIMRYSRNPNLNVLQKETIHEEMERRGL